MKLSEKLWEKNAHIYQRIIDHPFNNELANGTLDYDRFQFYMEQDSYYLVGFSRALAIIAARSGSIPFLQDFLHFAMGALVAERSLHASFLPTAYDFDSLKPSFACMTYVQLLLATAALAPIEEAIAAVLPCFWIYREVGLHIASRTCPNNPYQKWIDTYSSQDFIEATNLAISRMDEMAVQSTLQTQLLMERAFENSALLEWHFWDDAYHQATIRSGVVTDRISK